MRIDKEYDKIKFGKKSQMFFELSPFYYCTFVDGGGKKWRTLIHYWVASYHKKNPAMVEMIRGLDTVEMALKVGKKHGLLSLSQVDPKDFIYAIQERFKQNDTIRTILMSTGDVTLIYDGTGYLADNNRYGKLMMKLREIYNDTK